ncbi:Aste57867_2132 [Aphanomyces stellatus]|uniref:Aste57867_2132 protein n=1 Tax=Aphanomyces stellatus TaxID=120398 RepID=A0A485KCG6_9STRA|nr:hypothetical protein As57867_002127 [Aphanomyces stellatus]VFT79335.1 Aste57867_2132 [Aphanomyces stellatus]
MATVNTADHTPLRKNILMPPRRRRHDDDGTSPQLDDAQLCHFAICHNQVMPAFWACFEHKDKPRCVVSSCRNMVYSKNMCMQHGGKKACMADGCKKPRRRGAYCHNHDPQKKQCAEPGCTVLARIHGLCTRHGGGRICVVAGCAKHARHPGGYCSPHFKELEDHHGGHVRRDPESPDESDDDDDNNEGHAGVAVMAPNQGAAGPAMPTHQPMWNPPPPSIPQVMSSSPHGPDNDDDDDEFPVLVSSPPLELYDLDDLDGTL